MHLAQHRWSRPARPDISNAAQWDALTAAGIPCAASTSGKTAPPAALSGCNAVTLGRPDRDADRWRR